MINDRLYYFAVIAKECDCGILTLDEHFKDIQKSLVITLLEPNS